MYWLNGLILSLISSGNNLIGHDRRIGRRSLTRRSQKKKRLIARRRNEVQ